MNTGGRSHSKHPALQISFLSYSKSFDDSSFTKISNDSNFDHIEYSSIHLYTARSSKNSDPHQRISKAAKNTSGTCIQPTTNTSSTCTESKPKEKTKYTLRKSTSLKDLFFSKQSKELKKPVQTRSKFSDIVHKHLLPLNFISPSKQQKRTDTPAVSCPSLTVTPDTPKGECCIEKTKPENKNESHYLSIPNIKDHTVVENLTKTDAIFTTSFTHSTKTPVSLFLGKDKSIKVKSSSVQNLSKATKQSLVRSFSDVPTRQTAKQTAHQRKISPFLQSKMFKNDHVSQILDHLFIGSVESAYNEPLLCKLKIGCLLDMTNIPASLIPSSKKLHCPCTCAEENQHFRSRLIIQVDNNEKEDIQSYFSDINKFIHGAKKLGKRVLIFSFEGKSRAPTAAIQYLMEFENFLLREAYNLVKNQRSCVEINPGYMSKLESIERDLFPDAKHSMSFGNEYLNIADPQAIKCAWVDCTDS